jgi:hypothetical protein
MSTLAHYGGIDEIGVFVVPAILALLAIRWAERRARVKASSQTEEGDE